MQGSNTMRNIILSLAGMAILFAHSAYGVSANLRLEQATVSRKYDPVVYKLSLSFRYSVVSSQKQIKKPILRFMAIYTKPDGTREVIMRYSRDCRNTLKSTKYESVSNESISQPEVDTKTYKRRQATEEHDWFGEKIDLLVYRVELWYDGNMVDSIDSPSPPILKTLGIPEDWYIPAKYPDKFVYK